MSNPKSNDETIPFTDIQPEVQELTAEDAENVAGGILIGLNQPAGQTSIVNTGIKLMGDGSVFTGDKWSG